MVRLRGERAGPDGGISSHGPRAEELCSTARAVSKPTNCPPASVSVFKWAGPSSSPTEARSCSARPLPSLRTATYFFNSLLVRDGNAPDFRAQLHA
jgi:hypothetical protein